MRVLIDTTFARRGPSGTATYLERVVPELRALGVEVFEAAHATRRPPGGGGLRSARNFGADRWWEVVGLPRRASAEAADIVHHPLPGLSPRLGRAQVVTVHDLAFELFPDLFAPAFRRWARRAHRAAARRADAVIAVSRSTASEAIERWDLDPRKVLVAPHGPGHEPPSGGGDEARHFLYVGDDEPRKNVGLALEAHRLYLQAGGKLPLVLAGSATARQRGVVIERRPSEAALDGLYAHAAALVHPSRHEGFGLTLLEAMSAGAPVIATHAPGVTDTCGDAAMYADDAPAMAAAMHKVAEDGALRQTLRDAGHRRAAGFSWEGSAKVHLEAYTLALNGLRERH